MMIEFDSLQQFAKRSARQCSDLVLWLAKIENMAGRSSSASLQIGVNFFGVHEKKVIDHCDLDVELIFS